MLTLMVYRCGFVLLPRTCGLYIFMSNLIIANSIGYTLNSTIVLHNKVKEIGNSRMKIVLLTHLLFQT